MSTERDVVWSARTAVGEYVLAMLHTDDGVVPELRCVRRRAGAREITDGAAVLTEEQVIALRDELDRWLDRRNPFQTP